MSARKIRRDRERRLAKAARKAARVQGCVCNVEITFDRTDHPLRSIDGMAPVSVAHDDWCPLLRVLEERPPGLARTQLMLVAPERA
jgi:hypothetical protein